MSDNGLPKATMVNFIRDHISDKRKVSAEFTNVLLELAKQFIDKVSAHANEICQKEGKKTINNDHFFKALTEMGMGDIIKELEKTDESLKAKHQKKQEDKQRVQDNIEKMQQRKSEDKEKQVKRKEKMPVLQQNSKYKPIDLEQNELDFVEILEQDEQDEMEDQ